MLTQYGRRVGFLSHSVLRLESWLPQLCMVLGNLLKLCAVVSSCVKWR